MPRSKFMPSGLLVLGIIAGLAGPALAGDFDVSASNSTVRNAPPPPQPPRPLKPPPTHNPPAAVAAVRG